jgi:hypothetical protein
MHGLKSGSCRFWQRTDSPSGSNMLRRAAKTCSACKLAGVQIISLPTLANQILARTFFRSVANLFASPAVGKFSRASSAGPRLSHALLLEMGNQCRKTTLVAHFRGSTLQFCAEPQDLWKYTRVCRVVIGWRPRWRIKFSLERFSDSVALQLACPAVGKFSRASSAGGRRHLQLNFVNQIVSVAEDCLSPERTFHGCPLMHGLKSGSCRF